MDTLLREIEMELAQEEYSGLTHGKPYAYQKGCRGHLCRYTERTRRRAIRHKAATVDLPRGVQPDTRPREEQRWDLILECIRQHVCANAFDDLSQFMKLVEVVITRETRALDVQRPVAALQR
ncbi:hypothetical protein [Streptomyces sp. NPDC127100]|uniref:hypothetical protein n=1 Tax=Streptomyces sp. NPDC127100 TaxID=3347138 RepID=UPI00364F9015